MTTSVADLDPSEAEIRTAIHTGLRAYNDQYAGPSGMRPLAVFVRDETGAAIGGLEGKLSWGWLHVANFWLPEALRGQGLGRKVLQRAERIAVEQGCTGSYLDTFEFQALPFYKRQGYTVFGVLEDYPPGARRYYLQKALGPSATSPRTPGRDAMRL